MWVNTQHSHLFWKGHWPYHGHDKLREAASSYLHALGICTRWYATVTLSSWQNGSNYTSCWSEVQHGLLHDESWFIPVGFYNFSLQKQWVPHTDGTRGVLRVFSALNKTPSLAPQIYPQTKDWGVSMDTSFLCHALYRQQRTLESESQSEGFYCHTVCVNRFTSLVNCCGTLYKHNIKNF